MFVCPGFVMSIVCVECTKSTSHLALRKLPFSKIHKKSSLAIFPIYISSLKNRVSWNPGVRPFWENPGNCFFTFLLEYCPKYTVFWHTFSIFEHNYQQLFISLRKTDYQQPILLWKFHLFQLWASSTCPKSTQSYLWIVPSGTTRCKT